MYIKEYLNNYNSFLLINRYVNFNFIRTLILIFKLPKINLSEWNYTISIL